MPGTPLSAGDPGPSSWGRQVSEGQTGNKHNVDKNDTGMLKVTSGKMQEKEDQGCGGTPPAGTRSPPTPAATDENKSTKT